MLSETLLTFFSQDLGLNRAGGKNENLLNLMISDIMLFTSLLPPNLYFPCKSTVADPDFQS